MDQRDKTHYRKESDDTSQDTVATNSIAYIPPFKMIQEALGPGPMDLRPGTDITLSSEFFKFLIGQVLVRGFFDERWYLETNPDVQLAIERGEIANAFEHYVQAGYYESRIPGPFFVDRQWYETHYGDVAGALKTGKILDSAEHFVHTGYFEGRVSHPDHLRCLEMWQRFLGLR